MRQISNMVPLCSSLSAADFILVQMCTQTFGWRGYTKTTNLHSDKNIFPENVTHFAAAVSSQPLLAGKAQYPLLQEGGRRSILQSFIANAWKRNFHAFPVSFWGCLNLPPSPSSLFAGDAESLFSRSRSLNFGINSNNLGESRRGTSCFSGWKPSLDWKPAASHVVPVILPHVRVGRRMSSPHPTSLKFSHNSLLLGQKTRALPCASSSESLISPH